MRRHPADSTLQHKACTDKDAMASQAAENQVKIEAGGGVKRILAAMRSHPTDSELLCGSSWSCYA